MPAKSSHILAVHFPKTRSHLKWLLSVAALLLTVRTEATILWSDLGSTLVHETGAGADILGGTVKRNDAASDTLYFKFHVDPLSDARTEEYFAAFQFYDGNQERLAVGNSWKAWAYGAFNTDEDFDANKISVGVALNSSRPEPQSLGNFLTYELPRRGIESTIVFKVQFVPGGDDLVTVWLNPNLETGATEESQPESLTTRFHARAAFNQIRLRHGGGGGGWIFSDMAIATRFQDFVKGDTVGAGENPEHGDYPWTFQSWQQEQGLPQNSVRALTQTKDGYLWIGSDDGLSRFDGVHFVAFDTREGFHSGPVNVLFEDSHDVLWIGTAGGGLSRLWNGHFTAMNILNGLPDDSITALAEDGAGRLWVGTEAGLVILNGEHAVSLPATELFKGRKISALFKDRQGVMWMGVSGVGIFQFVDGKFAPVTDPSVEALLQDSHCLLLDQAGRVWVGAGDDFVLCREGGQWRRYRIPRHLARPYVNSLAEGPDGAVWAGSVSEGLFEFKDGKATSINASSGLLDNFVETLLADREGDLWVGTGAGLNRLRRSNLSVLGQNEGLGYGAVQGLAEIQPSVIWADKPSDGIFRWDGKNFSRLTMTNLSPLYLEVNALLKTLAGDCWVASAHGLVHFRQPGTNVEAAELLPGNWNVISLCEDRHDGLWAGTRDGMLLRLRQSGALVETNFNQSHAITAILQAPDDTLWIGTEGGGVYEFKNDGTPKRLGKHNGLFSDLIRTLYLDASHTLWIGTVGGGLSRWRDGSLVNFTTREGLPDNTISQILEDDSGHLWLGSNRGIASVSKTELENVALGKIPAVYAHIYGHAEGMPSEECTGGFYPAGLKTKSAQLWFSTLKGIVAVDPRTQTAGTPPPRAVLEEVLVDGLPGSDFQSQKFLANSPEEKNATKSLPGENLEIPPGQHRLEFHYTGLDFSAPEQIRFRYQLEGLDPDWVEAGTRRAAFYNYLPPGHYKFRVIACNNDGIWGKPSAAVNLTVSPHWWQSWWVIGLGTLGFVILLGGVIRIIELKKIQKHLRKLEQDRALARERARIAQDLHDDLGSSLARMSLLSGLVKSDKHSPTHIEAHARKLSQSADQTVRALEEIVWALRPGSDSLQSLMDYIAHFASELFEGTPTRCRLDLPHDLPVQPLAPDVRHNIFLIVKEALTNALKHASAKEVHVSAKVSDHILEIGIQDDGSGFEAALPKVEGKQHGLGNMRHRAETIGGTLASEHSKGKGTNIRLTVELPKGPPEG